MIERDDLHRWKGRGGSVLLSPAVSVHCSATDRLRGKKGSVVGVCELNSVIMQGGGPRRTMGVVRGGAWALQLTD